MPIIVPGDGGGGGTPAPPSDERFTVSELVEETLGDLSGHTFNHGQVTSLQAPISATAREFQVTDAGVVSRGIAEIGNELVYVSTSEDGNCTVIPSGRGYRATQPSAWPEGTEVTFSPRFPRHTILQSINDTITDVYPHLFGVGVVEFAYSPVVEAFELPADVDGVLAVDWDPVGAQDSWYPIARYRFDGNASTDDFPTGKSLWLLSELTPGRTVRVHYRKRPSRVSLEQSFTASGLPESAWRCIKYGALHVLSASLTLGQLGVDTAVSAEYSRTRSLVAVDVSERFYALHIQYRDEARARLLDEHPIRVNYTR